MFSFQQSAIQSYGREQDKKSEFEVQDFGRALSISGNTWKKLDFAYTITADTILELEFRSDHEGDIHAIGFDADNRPSSNQTFKLYGTQTWGITEFDHYAATAQNGEWQSYRINVGDFFTGSMSYLTFVNDHDVKQPNAESLFRNIRVYEEHLVEAGHLAGVQTFSESLTLNRPEHIYQFSIDETSDFNVILEGLSGDANLVLRRTDLGETEGSMIQTSAQAGNQTELLYETLIPGDYSLQVQAEYGVSTDYDLILSTSPDVAGTSHYLNVSTATYLGSLGDDQAAAIEISPRHELIVAGNFSASLGMAQTLLDATPSHPGQIARLSASGREVLSVVHLGHEINDMDVNRLNGHIVAGGDFGVTVLNDTADQVLWSHDFGQAVERVAIANDGTVVTLHNKTVTTWTPTGQMIAQATQRRSYVNDVAIHPETNLVYVAGFDNKNNQNNYNNPVQVAFLNAFETDDLESYRWQNWGFDANRLTSDTQNDMADTRGYRVSVGRDGLLYFLGEVAGGNSIFRWNGRDLSTPTLVKYDAFNDPYHSKSPHQTYFARLDPTYGSVLQGQLAFSRLHGDPNKLANAFRVQHGAIAADETGNIYISGQGFSDVQDRDKKQINGQSVGEYVKSDLTALVIANDFQSRKLWTPFTEEVGRGRVQGVAVGHGRAAILGTVSQGTVITTEDAINPEPFNHNEFSPSDRGELQDVYLATWGTDSLDEAASLAEWNADIAWVEASDSLPQNAVPQNAVTGTVDADVLLGKRSADWFVGGGSRDQLTGNGGADIFVYETLGDGGDVITDFLDDDQIHIMAQGFGLDVGAMARLEFGSLATSNQPTFLYHDGALTFNPDGTGSAATVAIAELQGRPNLTANQIQIVA